MYQTVSCFASLFVLIVADKRDHKKIQLAYILYLHTYLCTYIHSSSSRRAPLSLAARSGARSEERASERPRTRTSKAGRRRIEHLGMLVNCGEDSQVAASYNSASSCKLLLQLAVVRSIFLNSSSTDPPKRFLNRTQSTFIEHTVTLVNCYHN